MTRHRVPLTLGCVVLVSAAIAAADLQDGTARAYDEYSERATRTFLEGIRGGVLASGQSSSMRGPSTRDAEVVARPAYEDGIIAVPGGLVHHWFGTTFIAGVTLQDALDVSYGYSDYHAVYTPVIASRLLGRDADTYRVTLRIRGSGGGLSAVLDVTSRIQFFFPDRSSAYSISTSEEIRELRNPGTANERSLPVGRDSGYLWRAATFTHLVQSDQGVLVHTEALGLSRGFPPLLRWIIEPAARRLGRSSVERSLQEFSKAVRARAQA